MDAVAREEVGVDPAVGGAVAAGDGVEVPDGDGEGGGTLADEGGDVLDGGVDVVVGREGFVAVVAVFLALHGGEDEHGGVGVIVVEESHEVVDGGAYVVVGHHGEGFVGAHGEDDEVGAEDGGLLGEAGDEEVVVEAGAVVADGGVEESGLAVVGDEAVDGFVGGDGCDEAVGGSGRGDVTDAGGGEECGVGDGVAGAEGFPGDGGGVVGCGGYAGESGSHGPGEFEEARLAEVFGGRGDGEVVALVGAGEAQGHEQAAAGVAVALLEESAQFARDHLGLDVRVADVEDADDGGVAGVEACLQLVAEGAPIGAVHLYAVGFEVDKCGHAVLCHDGHEGRHQGGHGHKQSLHSYKDLLVSVIGCQGLAPAGAQKARPMRKVAKDMPGQSRRRSPE